MLRGFDITFYEIKNYKVWIKKNEHKKQGNTGLYYTYPEGLEPLPHDDNPCRPANGSRCRAHRGLTPPSKCTLPGTRIKKGQYRNSIDLFKRRRRDSNPRWVSPHNGFQNRHHQPLGHSSRYFGPESKSQNRDFPKAVTWNC